MDRTQRKTLLMCAIALTFAYITGCFIELSFNVAEWNRDNRIGVAFLGFCIVVITAVFIVVFDDE